MLKTNQFRIAVEHLLFSSLDYSGIYICKIELSTSNRSKRGRKSEGLTITNEQKEKQPKFVLWINLVCQSEGRHDGMQVTSTVWWRSQCKQSLNICWNMWKLRNTSVNFVRVERFSALLVYFVLHCLFHVSSIISYVVWPRRPELASCCYFTIYATSEIGILKVIIFMQQGWA